MASSNFEEEELCSERIEKLIHLLDLTKHPPSFDRVENAYIEADSNPCASEDKEEEKTAYMEGRPKRQVFDRQERANEDKIDCTMGNDSDEEPFFKPEDLEDLVWEVKFTKDALKVLQCHDKQVSRAYKKRIFSKIKKLAGGDWRPCQNMVKILSTDMKLFETKIDKGARILWEIALCFSPECGHFQSLCEEESSRNRRHMYSQVIRIWDIVLQHDNLQGSIEKIKESTRKGKDSAIKKQMYGSSQGKGSDRITRPERFIPCDLDHAHDPSECMVVYPAADVSSSGSLIKKFYTSTLDGLWYMLENPQTNVIFPFAITELEQEIIQIKTSEPAPIIVHGRSGTGKTTCCLYRLWKHFSRYECDLHQIYITKNPRLCTVVEKDFNGLCLSQMETRDFIKNRVKTLPNSLQNVLPESFPLFLTMRKFLLMLDLMLPSPFFERNEDGTLKENIPGWKENETSLVDCFVGDEELEDETRKAKNMKPENKNNRKEITYDVFFHEMWPRIKGSKKSPYSPALVWIEICSFILGSREVLNSDSEEGFLSYSEYLDLGKKEAPNFVGDRDEVYSYFRAYQKIKRENNYFDSGDLVFNLYHRLNLKRYPHNNWKLHEVYVDETQDFTQSELWLLICCCENPNDIFLTGDTAQCIMNGISFRFEDLKRMFYTEKEHLKKKTKNKLIVPTLHHMGTNYRSHSGILDLAASVIDLMKKLFPTSFDAMERDHGFFSGSKPAFIQSSSFSGLASLLTDKKYVKGDIHLGASQVILVASEDAKKGVPKELPKELVHTIFEAKGLEFKDVLLYNIFKHSKDKEVWRVITDHLNNLMNSQQSDGTNQDSHFEVKNLEPERSRPLKFDLRKHKLLNTELKYLYTAVTRARFNLWIFDDDETARKPMFEFLRVLKLVRTENNSEGEEDLRGFSLMQESTSSEWEEQGNGYFQEKMYSSAAYCYGKAGHPRKQKVASALHTIQKLSPRTEQYLHLAENFLQGQMIQEALVCLRNAQEPLLVGKLLEKLGKEEEALRIYKEHNLMEEVLRMILQQEGEHNELDIMLELKMYDKAAERCRQDIQLNQDKSVTTVTKLTFICKKGVKHYHTCKDNAKMKYCLDRHPDGVAAAEILVQLESKKATKSCLDEFMHDFDGSVTSLERCLYILYMSMTRHRSLSKETFSEVLEIITVMAICLQIRHTQCTAFLPSSFVDNIHFWDYVYKLEGQHLSILQRVQGHEMCNTKQFAKDLTTSMGILIAMLVDWEGHNIKTSFRVFVGCHDELEKILTLSLIVAINALKEKLDHLDQNTNKFFIPLQNVPPTFDVESYPSHVNQLLQGIANIQSIYELHQEFVKFLRARNENLLSCMWNEGEDIKTSGDMLQSLREELEREPLFGSHYLHPDTVKSPDHEKSNYSSESHKLQELMWTDSQMNRKTVKKRGRKGGRQRARQPRKRESRSMIKSNQIYPDLFQETQVEQSNEYIPIKTDFPTALIIIILGLIVAIFLFLK